MRVASQESNDESEKQLRS